MKSAGYWAKMARAEEQILGLGRELEAVKSDGSLQLSVGGDDDGIVLRVHVERQPPWERWGVLIGEIVHDLRSALDQLTWTLTITHSGEPPKPLTREWRSVQFPVVLEEERFWKRYPNGKPARGSALQNLWGIDPKLIHAFASVQPFRSGTRAERHPLAVLHALSVQDKHQALPLVAIAGRGGSIVGEAIGTQGRSHRITVSAPIEDGVAITRLRHLSGPATGVRVPRIGETVELQFRAHVDFDFGFAAGPPAFGGELLSSLGKLSRHTRRVLRFLELQRR